MALTLHGNNGLGTTNGTAAAPSLAAPDSDTGFYFGTNLIHATTGGTERLRITGDGPHLLLGGTADVNEITESSANAGMVIGGTGFGNGGLAIINSTTGAGRIYFGDATGSNAARQRGQINYYHSGDYMMFATAGGERLRITSGGHVLIGDEGNDNAFFKAHAADGEADDLYVGQFINAEATAGRNYGLNIQGGSNSTDHGFRVKNHAGSVQLLVRGDGNVGINETSPDNKLHVTTTNSTAYSTNTSNTQNITNALLKLQNLDGSDGGGVNNYVGIHFAVANGATSHAQLNYARTGDNAGAFQFKARNTGSVYPNLMTIKSNGLVGINSTSPAAYLDIGAHGTATPTLHVRNHTAAGSFSGNYGSEFRHSFNSVNHAMLIHTQEASDARRVLDISDSNGIFATFTNGKVGIGINAPVAPLHIYAAANDNLLFGGNINASDGGAIRSMNSDASAWKAFELLSAEMRIGGTNSLRLSTGGTGGSTERLRITSSGALLVGLTAPTYNSGDMQHEIKKNNNRTYTAPLMTGHSHLLLNNSDTTNNAFCGLGIRAGSGDGSIGYVYRGSANNADFVINTDGNGNGVERLRVFNGGSVLIGALANEAAGGSSSSGSARLVIDCEGLNVFDGVGAASNYGLVFANDSATNKANGIGFFNDGGTDAGGYIVHQDKGSNNIGDLVFGTAATSDSPTEKFRIRSDGQTFTKLENTTDYGPSNWARTGTGNQSNSSQAFPDPTIIWQNRGKSSSDQKYGSYIQSSSGGEKELYITIRNSSFYRITVKTSHNSTDADVAMWLVYGLNSSASGGTNNRITQVVNTSSGGFTCTQQNTHVNSHDSTIKIAFSGSSNQGLRALVEIIGGF